MLEDALNDIAVVDEGDNAQGGAAAGALKRVDFVKNGLISSRKLELENEIVCFQIFFVWCENFKK